MFTKITEADLLNKGNLGMPDTPNLTTAEMQAKLDELARDVIIPKFNNLIEELANEAAAESLGVTPPEGFVGNTIKLLLDEIIAIVKDNQLASHGHENKETLDDIEKEDLVNWDKLVEVFSGVERVASTITDSLTDIPNGHAIVEYMKVLGAGDMQMAVYDTTNTGVVDDAEKLGGELPEYYQSAESELLKTVAKEIVSAINEVYDIVGSLEELNTKNKTSVVEAVNEVNNNIPEILSSLEEIDANTETGKVVDALVIKEGFSQVNRNFGGLSFGTDGDGNYGYYGADGSLIPFKSGCELTPIALPYTADEDCNILVVFSASAFGLYNLTHCVSNININEETVAQDTGTRKKIVNLAANDWYAIQSMASYDGPLLSGSTVSYGVTRNGGYLIDSKCCAFKY